MNRLLPFADYRVVTRVLWVKQFFRFVCDGAGIGERLPWPLCTTSIGYAAALSLLPLPETFLLMIPVVCLASAMAVSRFHACF
jgi:hypothetical protein